MRQPIIEKVPVAGGDYTVARWPGRDRALLAVHGITASHRVWPPVVDALATDCTVIAPDLRGRGASSDLPPPYGLDAHVADLLATLDHHAIDECVVAGHSLGAYIALKLARAAPARIRALVLVDGGLALPLRPGATPEQVIAGILGPARKRLDMRFEDRAAYHRFWREHPALQDADAWNPYVEAYVDYDLIGVPGAMRSRVNADAVRVDARGLLDPAMVTLVEEVQQPMLLLTATRGLLNQPQPLMPLRLVREKCAQQPRLRHVEVPGTNHYTIVTGSGNLRVAREIDAFVAGF
jgi:pimeloyl-ACP methyl ester carboxylesterase